MIYEVQWFIDDGYVGKRLHKFKLDTDNLMDEDEWNDLSEDEKEYIFAKEAELEFSASCEIVVDSVRIV